MRTFILARYILREHIGPFFFAFFVITLFFLLNLLFRELSRILSKGLPWHVVLEFFMLNMAWIVALAVPMAVLTATLMAFGRLSADNEIAAMEANGISVLSIITPALVASAFLAAGLVWFNNHVLPDFNHRTRLLASDIARKRPTISIEPGVWFDDIPNYGLLAQEIVDSAGTTTARNLLINDYSSRELSRTISARRGLFELSPGKGALMLTLFDGEIQEIDLKKPEEFRRITFPKHIVSIAVDNLFLSRSESEYRGDREKGAAQMRKEVAEHRNDIANLEKRINTTIALSLRAPMRGLVPAPFDSTIARSVPILRPTHEEQARLMAQTPSNLEKRPAQPAGSDGVAGTFDRRAFLNDLLQSQQQLASQIERDAGIIRGFERKSESLSVEIQKKYSIPMACVVFILIGAPLGVMARRGGLATGGGVSLTFFLLYWASLVGGEDLADRQMLSPFWAMWGANIIVGLAGVFLLWRASREQTSLNFAAVLQKFSRRKN